MTKRQIGGLAATFVVGLGFGAAGNDSSAEMDALRASHAEQVNGLRGQVADERRRASEAEASIADAEATVATAEKKAATAERKADTAQSRAEKAAKRKLASRKRKLDERASELDDRESAISIAEDAWESGTIPGDARLRVGTDVQPGVYQSEGPTDGNCYWSRLSGDDGALGEIIANGNEAGPTTITVGGGDYMLELSGCEDFHKVG